MKRVFYTVLIVACGGAQPEPSQQVALPSATVHASATASTSPIASTTATRDAGEITETEPVAVLAMQTMQVELKRCYNRAIKADPTLRAAIRITIDVAPDGTVTKATPHSTPPVPAELEQCFVAAVSKTKFHAFGGSGATFELPINLVPSNP